MAGSALQLVRCHSATTDFSIDVTGLNGDQVFIVSGCTGSPPTDDIGVITVTGSSVGLSSLFVAVVGPNQTLSTINNPEVVLAKAGDDFGGLTVSETATRDLTRVSISVTGSVGNVEVNQVVRIQTDGSIDGDITATGEGPTFFVGDPHIGQVRAGVGISGSITSANGDIFAVRVLNVDPLPVAAGITGNIIAKDHIGTIYSTGSIGPNPSDSPINIRAGGRIEQIRTSADSLSADPLDLDIKANVGTGVDADGHYLDTLTLSGDSKLDSPLGLLQTAGDFEGNLKLTNLAVTATWPSSAPAGILVGGRLAGNIDIRYNLDHSKIIAQNMAEAFFNIGLRMTGAIIEFRRDQCDRTLDFNGPTFTIGYGTPPTEYTNEIRGMTGSNCPPVDMTETDWWFETPDCDGRTFDSLIRFSSTKGIDIRRMTLEITPNTHKAYIPRVEFIAAREMRIGTNPPEADASMEAGVVWSGDLLDGVGGNDPSNDYAEFTINGLIVSAVSPTADLWLKGAVPHPLTVLADLLGEAHLPALAAGQLIRIGQKLGDRHEEEWGCSSAFLNPAVQPCSGQEDVNCKYPCALNAGENSPRAFERGVQLAPIGRVIIANEDALEGQVVINAANTHVRLSDGSNALDFWRGKVDVTNTLSPPTVTRLSPIDPAIPSCAAQADHVPSHITLVNQYGGGDVGHVPYRIHYESSVPALERYCPNPASLPFVTAQALANTSATPVRVRFDGPITEYDSLSGKPARVYGLDMNWDMVDMTHLFEFSIDPADPNTLRVSGTSENDILYVMGSGFATQMYTLVPKTDPLADDDLLLCADGSLLGASMVPVASEPFMFYVIYDCNDNQTADPDDIAVMPAVFDCNNNGRLDECEIRENPIIDEDMDGIIDTCQSAGGCSINGVTIAGDFNCSGLPVTVQDIFDFLTAWFGNDPSADVNQSGSVTLQDLFDFLGACFASTLAIPEPCLRGAVGLRRAAEGATEKVSLGLSQGTVGWGALRKVGIPDSFVSGLRR